MTAFGRCWRWAVVIMISVLLIPAAKAAGQGATGSIIGQVTDEGGGALPGATVTVKSPALQVPQVTTVTDGQGEFRLVQLPVGTYSVQYELAGFRTTVVEGVILTSGFVAKVDRSLGVGALEETIVVSGAAPVVDVVSAGTRSELRSEQVEALPTTRDGITSFLAQVPGARQKFDVGGSHYSDTTELIAYGRAGDGWMLFEGLYASRINAGAAANTSHYDYSVIGETRVQAIGNSAEMPRSGLLVEMVTKSGGNDYHGEVVVQGTNDRFQGDNIDDRLRAFGIEGADKIKARGDRSAQLGGKIVQDKLWFFVAARQRYLQEENLGGPLAGGRDSKFYWYTFKGSSQITSRDRLIGLYILTEDNDYYRDGNQFRPKESTDSQEHTYHTAKAEWQATRGNAFAFSAQYGRWYTSAIRLGHAPGQPKTFDIRTLMESGDHLNEGRYYGHLNHHARGWMTWYKSGLSSGNHELKVGFDFLQANWNPSFGLRRSGDYELRFDNGVPFEIRVFNTPIELKHITNYTGTYFQDRWTIGRQLTLHLGVRHAYDAAKIPEQCRVAGPFAEAGCFDAVHLNTWNTVVPRLYASYDVFGNGRAVLKGGWGRFRAIRETAANELLQVNPIAFTTTAYRWRDQDGNRDYTPGEVNLALNGPDFVSFSEGTRGVPNPDDKPRTNDQFSVGYDQELFQNFAVRLAGIYARDTDLRRTVNTAIPYEAYNIPITNRDPGPDGVVGNADDGGLFTYFDFPAALNPGTNQRFMLINDPNLEGTYQSYEVSALKRMSRNWQLQASYSATKKNVPVPEGAAFNPNAEINVADNTWEWIAKFSGAFVLPYGLMPAFNFEHRSGLAQARQVLFRGGSQIRSIVLNVEPIGTLRMPNLNVLDVRIEKQFALPRDMHLDVRMDVFNVLVGSSRVDLQACKLEYSIVSPK